MKNVYHDIEIENDSLDSLKDGESAPLFKEEEAPRKRRVEYDEKGRVRKDNSGYWMKFGILIIAIVLVNLYFFHTCAPDLANLF